MQWKAAIGSASTVPSRSYRMRAPPLFFEMYTSRPTVKDWSMRHPNIEGSRKGEKMWLLTSVVGSRRQAMIRT